MDAGTTAVYKEVIRRYELYLAGQPVNVIDPDGSTPSKKVIRLRLRQLTKTRSRNGF